MNNKMGLYRRNGKLVYIKMPEFNELSFVKELWGDKKNMGDFGEVYSFPKEKWEMFYKKMVNPTDGKNFYCLVYDTMDRPVGEVSFHGYNSATKVARINIKIHYDHRGKGYAEEALILLLEYYFLEFGGEAIIDSVITNAGKSLLGKIGFEELNNFRNQGTYKLTKKKFLSCKIKSKKSIAILSYDDLCLSEYSLIFNIFNKVNEILKEEYFHVYSISNKENISAKGVSIKINENLSENKICPDILIIPGGKGIIKVLEDNYLVDSINKIYENCDYIATFSNGVYFLKQVNGVNGIYMPDSKWKIEGTIKVNRSFVDNGKIMISSNLIGNIELCISIVKKLAGDDIARKLAKEIGYLY
ncbi:GNAT family N-acetyltransferase [Clostridium nigeriense]|uniref:GNAT family N-acetyltransferase n=1 Tax=Clostridium nigeriense TaxID=1805470 RepID=UPI003D33534C